MKNVRPACSARHASTSARADSGLSATSGPSWSRLWPRRPNRYPRSPLPPRIAHAYSGASEAKRSSRPRREAIPCFEATYGWRPRARESRALHEPSRETVLRGKAERSVQRLTERCRVQPRGHTVGDQRQAALEQTRPDTPPASGRVDEDHRKPREGPIRQRRDAPDDAPVLLGDERAARCGRQKALPVAFGLVPSARAAERQPGADVAGQHVTD
jgi:hypothetical protein